MLATLLDLMLGTGPWWVWAWYYHKPVEASLPDTDRDAVLRDPYVNKWRWYTHNQEFVRLHAYDTFENAMNASYRHEVGDGGRVQ